MIQTTSREGDRRSDGRAARWDSHRASRRAELVHAARRAVHHHGAGISMDEIAAEIGTSKSILYRYFTDKAGLQAAVGNAVLAELREALEAAASSAGRPRDRIEAMVAVYLEMVERSPAVYDFVTRPEAETVAGALRGFISDIEQMVAELVLPVVRELPVDGHAELALARLWGAGLVGFVRAVAERWFGNREDQPEDAGEVAAGIASIDRARLTDLITDWLWDGAVSVSRRDHRPPSEPPASRSKGPSASPSSEPPASRSKGPSASPSSEPPASRSKGPSASPSSEPPASRSPGPPTPPSSEPPASRSKGPSTSSSPEPSTSPSPQTDRSSS